MHAHTDYKHFDFSKISPLTIALMKKIYFNRYNNCVKTEKVAELDLLNDCILIIDTVIDDCDEIKADIFKMYNIIRIQNKFIGLFLYLRNN